MQSRRRKSTKNKRRSFYRIQTKYQRKNKTLRRHRHGGNPLPFII